MSGKSIDELNLSDAPLIPTGSTDPRGERWWQFLREIDDLLATGKVTFAEDTLRSIQETVEKTQRVTEGQERAVRNIEAGAERGMRYRGSRRYEGYRR